MVIVSVGELAIDHGGTMSDGVKASDCARVIHAVPTVSGHRDEEENGPY